MFNENLRAARQRNNLSQKDMAKMLFISQQAYAKYEIGTASPNPEMLSQIAKILEISVDQLLGREEKNVPSPSSDTKPLPDILYRVMNLSDDKQKEVFAFIEFKEHQQKEENK